MTAEMESSWLVQRLTRPPRGTVLAMKDNPFSFGGGLQNGGLSDEAMDLLRGIFAFDYMGASEFEWGAVPEALRALASRDDLVAHTFTIPLAEVEKNWRDCSTAKPPGEATVFLLAPAPFAEEAERRIRLWASGKGERLKESTRLSSALRPIEEWDRDVCGWLELDNGFAFFTDEEMWRKTCALFGVESEVAA